MTKGKFDLSWFSRISDQYVLEINARMEKLEHEARESAGRTLQVSEKFRELQAILIEHVAEGEKLRSDVARLSKQLEWISDETQKTGKALFERLRILEDYLQTANDERELR